MVPDVWQYISATRLLPLLPLPLSPLSLVLVLRYLSLSRMYPSRLMYEQPTISADLYPYVSLVFVTAISDRPCIRVVCTNCLLLSLRIIGARRAGSGVYSTDNLASTL